MFDLGWTELLVIGVVALIVVGPKDLPVLFRNVGRFVGKAKGMAREFSRAMNDAADEAGVKDVAQGLKAAANPMNTAMDGVKQAAQDMAKSIDPTKFDPDSETGKLSAERA
ncbi:MAG: Sec-independent protein translocase protein TatB, partial [Pseudomonadota bacterium]|nr:Sec-independent protein translocase protein TatB [Pseudomonadota bacterium]